MKRSIQIILGIAIIVIASYVWISSWWPMRGGAGVDFALTFYIGGPLWALIVVFGIVTIKGYWKMKK